LAIKGKTDPPRDDSDDRFWQGAMAEIVVAGVALLSGGVILGLIHQNRRR
jgi:hypothetical protein